MCPYFKEEFANLDGFPNLQISLGSLNLIFKMSQERRTSVILGFKDVFPSSEPEEISNLIEDIPSTQSLQVIAHLSAQLHTNHNNLKLQIELLGQWAGRFRSDVRQKIEKASKQHIKSNNFLFVNQPTCLLLIQEILDNYNSLDNRELEPEDEFSLFKAYLVAADQITKAGEELASKKKMDLDGFLEYSLTTQLPISDLKFSREFYIQIYKAAKLFNFFETNEGYDKVLDDFLDSIDTDSWIKYLQLILNIYVSGLVKPGEEINKTILQVDENSAISSFLKNFTLDLENFHKRKDFIGIREKPVIKIEEGNYLFLNLDLFVDKIFEGILFDIYSHVKGNDYEGIDLNSFPNLKSSIGFWCTEQVIFYSIMEEITKHNWVIFTGEELSNHFQGGPDFYIRRRSKIFLFEFKDILVSSAVKNSGDLKEITDYLDERLISGTADKNKGYSQLLSFIQQVNDEDIMDDIDDIEIDNPKYYPILVVTDRCLDEYGVNYIVHNYSEELIEEFGLEGCRIQKPVIVQLDDLIRFCDNLKDEDVKINSIFDQYVGSLKHGDLFQQTESFSNYVRIRIGEDQKFPEIVNESLDEVLGDLVGDLTFRTA